jgi:ABC-2 type transport system permease protein
MSNIWSIVKKEIRSYFSSPIAYVVIFGFQLLVGYFFYSLIWWFNSQAMQMAQNPYYSQQVNINQMVFTPLFHNMSIILILVAPLLTMRLLSEEKKSGTDELLYTSPLSILQIVLGKYFAALFMLIVMLALTASCRSSPSPTATPSSPRGSRATSGCSSWARPSSPSGCSSRPSRRTRSSRPS